MSDPVGPNVTELLIAWRNNDHEARDRLIPLVYQELYKLAGSYLGRERSDHTLQPTALVNEAYIRLVDQRVTWQNRSHFYGVAAQVMRRILSDHARKHQAEKRGGGLQKVQLNESIDAPFQAAVVDLVALDDALERLNALDTQQAKIVELRFFGGLTVEQTAEVLGISPATVKRQWSMARTWLKREIETGGE